ncbi:MAG: Nif3-like dinuclear metal center hexameric protein [Clostridia bacterium]|nr:Nif3-like dinuclear metal center hexameric protein [Clostridia bacterium]
MEIKKILEQFNELAPLSLSYDAQKNLGYYDNSGLMMDCSTETDCVVCALDLTDKVVDYAIEVGAKLIITHHPAIYHGIKTINGTYIKAISAGITVYSAHLNLDTAAGGIEDGLAKLAGAKDTKTLTFVNENYGFGRIFKIETEKAENVVNSVIGALNTTKYIFFGCKDTPISTVATFCGAGLSEQGINLASEADLLISADISHHVLLTALNKGKCVLQLTHYASEVFAMKAFIEELFERKLKMKYYFCVDERFI